MCGLRVLFHGSFTINAFKRSSNRHSASSESSSDSLLLLNISADKTERNDNIVESQTDVY